MTLEEAWSGRKPSVDHFKVFGCIAYAHIPDQKRTKLDDKGAKCIFLGVSEHSKAYKLFNPIIEKVITSRDVVFDEEKTWVWSGESKKQQQIPANFDAIGDSIEQSPEPDEIPPEDDLPADDQSPQIQRPRKRPSWMIDYVSGDELSDDDTIAHFALFADSTPFAFEDAVRDPCQGGCYTYSHSLAFCGPVPNPQYLGSNGQILTLSPDGRDGGI
ncbi:hypothetical protein MRB53_029427 [Persea americana]|uniref:Uncharacterized protein n=1 Tax=Persea americana TaxID=3435 RepID=A0ACC2KIQ5_PERAE|nr:hypothetical protein MRB53_029427 [Persea americana]